GVSIVHAQSDNNLLLSGYDSPDLVLWLVVLCIQAMPYLAAIIMSLLGAKVHGAKMTVAEAK
ncbi:MAG TPA: hypothetical protein VFY78_08595, partial [Gammaproteobacteria bacterium]|nr:hypothetical protein [Gammaproteobacteria bacterium]